MHLVNIAAVKQYDGLKHGGDFSDARHLEHLLRLNILPAGYICPREQCTVRNWLRKRNQLVRRHSTQIPSISNLMARNLGTYTGGNEIKRWPGVRIEGMPPLDEQKLALEANPEVTRCLDGRSTCWNATSWQSQAARGPNGARDRQSHRRGADVDHRAGDR